jgi:hypothetical protein
LNWIATCCNNGYDNNKEGGGQPRQGGPPQGGEIHEDGQGKQKGWVSAEEVHSTAVKADNVDTGFLLMVEATVATATTSWSNRSIGGIIVIGSGDDDDHPGIVIAEMRPQTMMAMRSWLMSWWGPNDEKDIAASAVDSSNFWFGFSPL